MDLGNFNGVGGGTVLYSAVWPRLLPSDFRTASEHGVGDDWPLSYTELQPFYEETDRQFGVSGLGGNPAYPPGDDPPLPPLPIGHAGLALARAHARLGWHWWPEYNAILSADHDGRARVRPTWIVRFGVQRGRQGVHRRHALAARYPRRRAPRHGRPRARDRGRRTGSSARCHLDRSRGRRALPGRRRRAVRSERHGHRAPAVAVGAHGRTRRTRQLIGTGGAAPDGPSRGARRRILQQRPGELPRSLRRADPVARVRRHRSRARLRRAGRSGASPRLVDRWPPRSTSAAVRCSAPTTTRTCNRASGGARGGSCSARTCPIHATASSSRRRCSTARASPRPRCTTG